MIMMEEEEEAAVVVQLAEAEGRPFRNASPLREGVSKARSVYFYCPWATCVCVCVYVLCCCLLSSLYKLSVYNSPLLVQIQQ